MIGRDTRQEQERKMIREDKELQVAGRSWLLGTCIHLAQTSGLPAWVLRGGAIVALCLWFKLTLIAYCVGALYYHYRR
jgi:phage shock protein PspC (stress-responsive transcriptional regulator)